MMFLHTPTLTEDAKHASVVITSAVAAIAATVSLFNALQSPAPEVTSVQPVAVAEAPIIDAALGADRMYGTVRMVTGEEVTGYLRWNGREASWADVLPATEANGNAVAGVQFGHMSSLEPVRGRTVRATLKSGTVTELAAIPARRGESIEPLTVESADGMSSAVAWKDVAGVTFLPEPLTSAPQAERIHGTLVTKSGLSFTGYVAWNLDRTLEDQSLRGAVHEVSFSEISEVRWASDDAVSVRTLEGQSYTLVGGPDVGRANRGISVSDPALGNVVVPFERFRELRMHPAETPTAYEAFDGGDRLRGVVLTEAGSVVAGAIRWDRDEVESWEMLDGQHNGIHFHIEMDQISWIEKTWLGATVELHDGRSFYLLASNDVNWTNKGIEVTAGSATQVIQWNDFDRVDFTPVDGVAAR